MTEPEIELDIQLGAANAEIRALKADLKQCREDALPLVFQKRVNDARLTDHGGSPTKPKEALKRKKSGHAS